MSGPPTGGRHDYENVGPRNAHIRTLAADQHTATGVWHACMAAWGRRPCAREIPSFPSGLMACVRSATCYDTLGALSRYLAKGRGIPCHGGGACTNGKRYAGGADGAGNEHILGNEKSKDTYVKSSWQYVFLGWKRFKHTHIE